MTCWNWLDFTAGAGVMLAIFILWGASLAAGMMSRVDEIREERQKRT